MKSALKEVSFQLILYIANHWVAFIPLHWVRLTYYRHVCRFRIGKNSSIHMGARFLSVRRFEMGDNCVINENCVIGNRRVAIKIGNNVVIGPECHLRTGDHDVNDPLFAVRYAPIEVNDYAFVGLRAVILKGVKLGEGSVVAAGAIVTKNVAPYEIVAGNPAKKIAERARELKYDPTWRPLFQ